MRSVPAERLVEADFLLSIVPPAAALTFAQSLVPALSAASRKPVFVDCNAVSPATVRRIASVVEGTGTSFVDAGIIGPPPKAGLAQPSIYASGPEAARLTALREHGLDVRVLAGRPVGAASALKLSYAGITKGFMAVATAMTLAATRVGATNELHQELVEREAGLLAALSAKVPDMLPKAYRWVAEMREIALFATPDAAGELYLGAANVYERVARAMADEGPELEALRTFFASRPE